MNFSLISNADSFQIWSFLVYTSDPSIGMLKTKLYGIYDKTTRQSTVFFPHGDTRAYEDAGGDGFKAVIGASIGKISKAISATMVTAAILTAGVNLKAEEFHSKNQRIVNIVMSNTYKNKDASTDATVMRAVRSALADNDRRIISSSAGSGKVYDADIIISVYDNDNYNKTHTMAIADEVEQRYGYKLDEKEMSALAAFSSTGNIYPVSIISDVTSNDRPAVAYIGVGKNLYDAIRADPVNGERLIASISAHEISHARNRFSEAGAAVAQGFVEAVDPTSPVARVVALDVASNGLNVQQSVVNHINQISHDGDEFTKIHQDAKEIAMADFKKINKDLEDILYRSNPKATGFYADIFSANRIKSDSASWVLPSEYADILRNGEKRMDQGDKKFASPAGYLFNIANGLTIKGYQKEEISKYLEQLVMRDLLTAHIDKEFGVLSSKTSREDIDPYYKMFSGVLQSVDYRMEHNWDNSFEKEKDLGVFENISRSVGISNDYFTPGRPKL